MVRYHCIAVDGDGGDAEVTNCEKTRYVLSASPHPKQPQMFSFGSCCLLKEKNCYSRAHWIWTIQIKGDSTAQGITVQSLFIVTTTPCDVKDECQSRLPHASIPLNNYTTTTPLNSLHSAVYCCVAATDFSIPAVISKTSSGSGGNDAVIVPSSFK